MPLGPALTVDREVMPRTGREVRRRARSPGRMHQPAQGGSAPPEKEKRKRKFPYRKTADLEREIAEVEGKVAALEDLLGQPATWRDPVKAVTTQDRHKLLKETLARLYEHWEEAVELN